jgi:2-methylcitrate dehydratase PrpD
VNAGYPAYLVRLAGFLADFRFEELPASVIDQAHYVIADTIAAIAAGSAEPENRMLAERMAIDRGAATVIGSERRTSAATASLLNGTAGTALEMDEGNRFARGHPAVHCLPAAIAVAEIEGRSGRDLLTAFVLGYEVGARLGMASELRPQMHMHGTWGTVGAAVSVGRLAGFNAQQFAELINIASTLSLATSMKTALQGGTVRNVYAGMSNCMGLMARDLVQSGFTGERDGLGSIYGSVVSERFDPEALVADLGRSWQITRNYFKRHGCCRYNHAALDALLAIMASQGPIGIEDIGEIAVDTYGIAATLDDQAPRSVLAAKFSLPFAIATTLVRGSSGMASFTSEALRDPTTRTLAQRVTVREDRAMTALLPQFRPARILVRLRNGRELVADTRSNRGDDADPYSRGELTEKFFELTARVWPRSRAESVHRALMSIEQLRDVAAITGN